MGAIRAVAGRFARLMLEQTSNFRSPDRRRGSSRVTVGAGMSTERVGITPKSWTAERHFGVLHLGKRWYVVTAEINDAGKASGVRLDGPFADRLLAEAAIEDQYHRS